MADYSSYRVAGYVVTILVHVSNMVYMSIWVKDLRDDPNLKAFLGLQPRYFTCWNFGLQVIYANIAFFCEVLMLRNSGNKNYTLNKHLRGLRDRLFAGIMFPCTMVVFTVFWSLFLLNRELIFPKYTDRALTPLSNHVIHTFIVPVVLWEAVFRPRTPPSSHKRNLLSLLVHLAVYFSVLTYTYLERGSWIYPIFDKLYGTIYFPMAITTIVLMAIFYYYLQWAVTGLVWGKRPVLEKNK